MAACVGSLTDLELLRQARSSTLMDDPLFAELTARFEELTEPDNRRELNARVYAQDERPGDKFKTADQLIEYRRLCAAHASGKPLVVGAHE